MRDSLRFLKHSLTKFRTTGALVPSSPRLAKAMVNEVPALNPTDVLVELGPGTGVFTKELVERFPGQRVVTVEFNDEMAVRLAERFPQVQVVSGCASQLAAHLATCGVDCHQVAAVVSGLPLLSLPRELGKAIFAEIAAVLQPGRRYIQFTYSRRAWRRHDPAGFRLDQTRRVWLNFPPASVLPFTRLDTPVSVAEQ